MNLQELAPNTRVMLQGAVRDYLRKDQLQDYRPYPKQFRFHMQGASWQHRLMRAANQSGKSFSGAAETAMHLTGEYPEWWPGWRFSGPIDAMVAGVSGDAVRDVAQKLLLGEVGRMGTGMVPERCITPLMQRAKGVGNLIDFVRIRHVSGGTSNLRVRYYTQDRKTWQGLTLHWIWLDEEMPEDLYQEAMARLTATKGRSILTFTPLLGYTEVVARYMDPNKRGPTRTETVMTLHDVEHLTEQEIENKILEYPEHERPARIRGEPSAGEGAIFPVADERVIVEPIPIPDWWPRIAGMDFGWSDLHPFAAIQLAIDLESDVYYVISEFRESRHTPAELVLTLKHWGYGLPWAWPKDGGNERAGDGIQQADLFRAEHLNLLPEHAQFAATMNVSGGRSMSTISVERGLMEMLQRMKSGRFKVFDTCQKWMDEKRRYHRKDGKVVKLHDDLLDATRYAVMMARMAEPLVKRDTRGVLSRNPPDWRAF